MMELFFQALIDIVPTAKRPTNIIPTEIIDSVVREKLSARFVEREFQSLVIAGAKLNIVGRAKDDPERLNIPQLRPKHKIQLFDTTFYFTNVLQIPELRFFVGYVVQQTRNGRQVISPRIIYKDLSLIWRSASHFTNVDDEIWVGKGDTIDVIENGEEMVVSNEATTDLPLEIQTAVENLLGFARRASNGEGILDLVLRQSPGDRLAPYQDFTTPRRRAAENPKNLINRGNSIATFTRKNNPESLKVLKGYEPNFAGGILEHSRSRSKLYGGALHRVRVLSRNKKVQYYFFAGSRHVWIASPQALTTELSSYGVRTIDVAADDDLFIPGFEYHHFEETRNGMELYSQIPEGFAGEVCAVDDAKADASPWLDRIPLINQFRNEVLGKNK